MKIIGILGVLILLGLGLYLFPQDEGQTTSVSQGQEAAPVRKTIGPVVSRSIFSKVPVSKKEPIPEKLYLTESEIDQEASQLVASLNRPEATALDDVRLLKKVFRHYRSAFKENPTGAHQEMVHLLAGGNRQGISYIPKNHPALVNGKLHDRWGTPFYFHQISRDVIEVRSAGADKKHWNEDDVVIQ